MSRLHKLKVNAAAYAGMFAYAFVDSLFRKGSMHGFSYGPKMSITTWISKYVTEDEFDEIFPTQEPDGTK